VGLTLWSLSALLGRCPPSCIWRTVNSGSRIVGLVVAVGAWFVLLLRRRQETRWFE